MIIPHETFHTTCAIVCGQVDNQRVCPVGALTHRLQKAHAHRARLKRGGGVEVASLDDIDQNDAELANVPPTDAAYFDRAWALGLLNGPAIEGVTIAWWSA